MLKADIVVVMPTKKPSHNMLPMIDALRTNGYRKIVVVNDGCKSQYDEFFETIKIEYGCDVLTHVTHLGKGRSLKNAFNYVLANYPYAEGIITIDDVVTHRIDEVEECAANLKRHPDDMILGSRDFNSSVFSSRARTNNKIKQTLIKILTGINVRDTSTGLRGIPISLIEPLLTVEGEGLDYELNTLLYSKQKGISIREFLVEPDTKDKAMFNPLLHSYKIYWVFLSYCMTSVVATIVDFLVFSTAIASTKLMFPTFYIVISTVIARVCSASVNFYLSKNKVFKKDQKNNSMLRRFFLIAGIQMGLSALLVSLIYYIIPITETIVKIFVDMILFFVFYQIQREWVFNETKNQEHIKNLRRRIRDRH